MYSSWMRAALQLIVSGVGVCLEGGLPGGGVCLEGGLLGGGGFGGGGNIRSGNIISLVTTPLSDCVTIY